MCYYIFKKSNSSKNGWQILVPDGTHNGWPTVAEAVHAMVTLGHPIGSFRVGTEEAYFALVYGVNVYEDDWNFVRFDSLCKNKGIAMYKHKLGKTAADIYNTYHISTVAELRSERKAFVDAKARREAASTQETA